MAASPSAAMAARISGSSAHVSFGLMIRATGSLQYAILSVIPFFVAGALLLALVDVDAGRRAAREAEGGVRAV